MDSETVAFSLVTLAILTAYAGFQQWLRQERRLMIHRERLAAIEKGLQLPPLEQEIRRNSWTMQRLLLFAGLIWVSVGIGSYLMLSSLIGETFHYLWALDGDGKPIWISFQIRNGMQWVGLALFGIGVSHLIVYAMGKTQER